MREPKFGPGEQVEIHRKGHVIVQGRVVEVRPSYRYLVAWDRMSYSSVVPEEKLERV